MPAKEHVHKSCFGNSEPLLRATRREYTGGRKRFARQEWFDADE